jgi:hypothetical protein
MIGIRTNVYYGSRYEYGTNIYSYIYILFRQVVGFVYTSMVVCINVSQLILKFHYVFFFVTWYCKNNLSVVPSCPNLFVTQVVGIAKV